MKNHFTPTVARMAMDLLTRVPLQGGEVDAFCRVRAAIRSVAEQPDVDEDDGTPVSVPVGRLRTVKPEADAPESG